MTVDKDLKISIVICGRGKTDKKSLFDNIEATISFSYEIIYIDNSQNKYTIFEAYNLGIKRSSGLYICFIHDDILFHSKGWGNTLIELFQDSRVGLIGIAGSKSKTKTPSLWWRCPSEDKIFNIIQHVPNKGREEWISGFGPGSNEEVVVIDGVFMAARKDDRIFFDTSMKGFHNYDLNISFEYKRHEYKLIVTNEIVIEHFSLGSINEEWVESSLKIHEIYNKSLPLCLNEKGKNLKQEIGNARWFIKECLKFSKFDIAYIVWKELFKRHPFLKFHLIYWKNNLKENWHLIKRSAKT